MATDPQDQQVANRPGQTAPVPLPEGLQPNIPVPSEFAGWNKLYVKQGEPVPAGWRNLSAGKPEDFKVEGGFGGGGGGGIPPTHPMLTADGTRSGDVPVSQMQTARNQGYHVAIPMQAPAPDNREGWIPLHNATAALKAGFQHIGHYKQAMDDALSAVRDKRNDIATAAADAIARHTPNYDLMPPEVQNDLKEMVGMGVGFFTGGAMQPGMSSEEAKAASSVKTPLTSTVPPLGLSGTTIEPSEPSMQLGRVPEKPIPAERQLAAEPGPRTLEATATEPGKYAVSVPPEQSTGRPEWDEAIKKGGAIPGGFQKGAPEEGIPNYAQFHDPQTGSSLLLPEDQVTSENVATHLAESRAKYAVAAAPSEETVAMAEKDRQFPLKQPYTIEVTNPNEETHQETIQAFSVRNARQLAEKQFPDAKSLRLESFGERTPSTDYVVPNEKPLSVPPSSTGLTFEDTMHHELGHAMVGANEGMINGGIARHTHPLSDSTTRAAMLWNMKGFYKGYGSEVIPEKLPGVVRSFLGGVAQDEIRGLPRAANVNFDYSIPTTDGERAYRILRRAGETHERALDIMHQALDQNKQYLTQPAVRDVINENALVREPDLSRQYHFSPDRINNMHAEVQRRMGNVQGTAAIDNRTANGENRPVSGAGGTSEESLNAPSAGQSVPAQASLPFGSSPEAAPAIAAAPPVQGMHPQAQDWAGTVQKIAAKMGKDAAIEAGRRILGSARLDPNATNRPEIAHLNDWLNKWESTVSPKELEARMNMLEVNPLKVIQGTGENPKNAEQAATAAGVKDPKDLSDISSSTKKNLLSVNADAKTVKGQKKGYMTGILYLAPDTTSGIANTCPFATEGCRKACLFTAGRAGIFPAINEARTSKTRFFKFDKDGFMNNLSKNVGALVRKADREGYTPAVRLNGTSDLPWENVKGAEGKTIMEQYPNVQFYDYTKNPSRMDQYLKGGMPKNYHLTFSRSETNDAAAMQILKDGGNAAVVFDTKRGKPLPTDWNGFKVIDGDETDVRFLDDKSTVIGLRAKGKAKKDTTGFVLNVKSPETKVK